MLSSLHGLVLLETHNFCPKHVTNQPSCPHDCSTRWQARKGRHMFFLKIHHRFRCPGMALVCNHMQTQMCRKDQVQTSYCLSFPLIDCWKIPASSLFFLEKSSEVFQQTSSLCSAEKDEEASSDSASQTTSVLVFLACSLFKQARLVCLI